MRLTLERFKAYNMARPTVKIFPFITPPDLLARQVLGYETIIEIDGASQGIGEHSWRA